MLPRAPRHQLRSTQARARGSDPRGSRCAVLSPVSVCIQAGRAIRQAAALASPPFDPPQGPGPLHALAFAISGGMLACAEEKVIQLWEPVGGSPLGVLRGTVGSVLDVCFSADDKHVLARRGRCRRIGSASPPFAGPKQMRPAPRAALRSEVCVRRPRRGAAPTRR